jgi:hypothetical protein
VDTTHGDFRRHWQEVIEIFLKIGALSYGGPASMGIMQTEVQEKRSCLPKGWSRVRSWKRVRQRNSSTEADGLPHCWSWKPRVGTGRRMGDPSGLKSESRVGTP